MDFDRAQLSSLASSLAELAGRVTAMAEDVGGSPREDAAADLFEVERHLHAAAGRLQSLLDRS